jgi:hypothetical protein
VQLLCDPFDMRRGRCQRRCVVGGAASRVAASHYRWCVGCDLNAAAKPRRACGRGGGREGRAVCRHEGGFSAARRSPVRVVTPLLALSSTVLCACAPRGLRTRLAAVWCSRRWPTPWRRSVPSWLRASRRCTTSL